MMNRPGLDPDGETMDVTLSVGFLKGIIAQENSKHAARDWVNDADGYDRRGVRALITALVPDNTIGGGGSIASAPLEITETMGRNNVYTAIFPLKGGKVSSSITIPGLLKSERLSSRSLQYGQQQSIKPQPIDLIIGLVNENEQITIGKATILATGEEIRTKQVDLPIEVSRDSIMRSQKKSSYQGKKASSMSVDRHGDIAPAAFKHDRTRRKYKIERDAVLRVFIKSLPATNGGFSGLNGSRSLNGSRRRRSMTPQSRQPSSSRRMNPHPPQDFQGQRSSSSRRMNSNPPQDFHNMSRHSSSRSRSHGGIPLMIEPRINQGYRASSPGPPRTMPPGYGGGGIPNEMSNDLTYGESASVYGNAYPIQPSRARSVPRQRPGQSGMYPPEQNMMPDPRLNQYQNTGRQSSYRSSSNGSQGGRRDYGYGGSVGGMRSVGAQPYSNRSLNVPKQFNSRSHSRTRSISGNSFSGQRSLSRPRQRPLY